MAELRGVEVLQSEIEKAKDKLKEYNENIKKLTGRDPTRPGIRRLLSNEGTEREENDYPNRASRGRGRVFGMTRHSMDDSGPPVKRRAVGGAFSRLGPVPVRRRDREDSPYEEELPNKLSVHSSVVSTSRESKNRKEIMQEQTKDKEGMQRNRRMFGLLLGTLNKFRTESKTMESKEYQRKRIEEKLEENAEKEKRKFKQETKLLIEEMHLEQSKISRLQQKMEMVQEHAERAGEVKKLKNFIVTKTQPRIFWKPMHMSAALENKLKESRKFVDGMLQESNDRLEKEIKELMERENKREERIKMRLREDGLLEDGDGKGEVGEDEGNNNEIMGESGRVVEVKEEIDQPNPVAERLGRDHEEEEERLDAEMDDLGDPRKKIRRTVVVEREVSSDSESEVEPENREREKSDVDKDHAGSDKETEGNTSGIQPGVDEPAAGKNGGANEDLSADRHRDAKEPGSSASESESSDSERELARERQRNQDREEQRNKDREEQRNKDREEQRNKDREEQRNKDREEQRNKDREEQRNKDREEQRNKDRNHKESKKDRKRDKEDSEERNTERHRRSEDKRHSKRDSGDKGKRDSGDKGKRDSGDKGRARRDSHEEKRDKDRRRDSHDGGKKSSSRRTKDRKRYSDSEESDVEVKQEKEVGKNKDTSHAEPSDRDRDTIQRRPKVLDDAEVEID